MKDYKIVSIPDLSQTDRLIISVYADGIMINQLVISASDVELLATLDGITFEEEAQKITQRLHPFIPTTE